MPGPLYGERRMSQQDYDKMDRRQLLKRVTFGGLAAALPACSDDAMQITGGVTGGGMTTTTGTMTGGGMTSTGMTSGGTSMTSTGAAGQAMMPPTTSGGMGPTSNGGSNVGGSGMTGGGGSPAGGTGTGGSTPTGGTGAAGSGGTGGVGEGGANTGGAGEGGAGGSSTNGDLMVPPWDDVPTCSASNTDGAGQGPFYIHNEEKDDDIDLFRQDIRGRYDESAEPGTNMELHLRILDSTSSDCNGTPVAGIEVYIWHTDGQGFYSGFGNPGDQKPDEPYAGVPGQNDLDVPERFCRGAAITDENGVVSFLSIFPGWYNGRDVHIHFVALQAGSASRGRMTYSGGDHIFTTQFYFEPSLTDSVHKASEPYLRRTMLSAYQGAIQADEAGNSGLRAKATFDGTKVVAQMQILLDPS